MTELTLFGKAMDHLMSGVCDAWRIEIGAHDVIILGADNEWQVYFDRYKFGYQGATKELARDDAERTLRALRDALTEVIGDG